MRRFALILLITGCASSTSSSGGGSGGVGGGSGGSGGAGGGTLKCGNGTLETDEVCENLELRGKTCVSEGFTAGTLKCAPTCILDRSGCWKCGDGVAAGTEFCDGSDFRGKTCASLFDAGFQGALSCVLDCTGIDTSQCMKPPGRDEPCNLAVGCPAPLVCQLTPSLTPRCQLYCDAAAIGTQGTCPTAETCRDGGIEFEGARTMPPTSVQCPQTTCAAGYRCPDAGPSIQSFCLKFVGLCRP